jgi:uncharacterized membrane protein YdjX (TVP38/TMEM64 family)
VAPTRERRRSKWSSLSWVAPLALVLALLGAYFGWPAFRGFVQRAYEVVSSGEGERIQQWVRGYGPWGVVVLLGLMFLQAVVAVLPSIATMVASILAYGPFWGGLLAWGGMMLTGSFMFAIGRALGPVVVESFIGEKTSQKIEKLVDRYGSWAVVLARLTPFSSSDGVSFIAGALAMTYFHFILAMAAGTLPLVVLIAWLGEDMGRLKLGLGILSGLAFLALVGHLLWQRYGRHDAHSNPGSELSSKPE